MSVAAPAGTLVELLHAKPESGRAAQALDALGTAIARSGTIVRVTTKYVGFAPWLLCWGPGAPDRQVAMADTVARGGHAVALDCSYWSRASKVRISIDAPHPQAQLFRRALPASRFAGDPVQFLDRWDAKGPVIVAGIGRKSRAQYGEDRILAWEAHKIAEVAALGRSVIYRRKTPDAPVPHAVRLAPDTWPIDRVLQGASLVITWHSNVAVDALRLGIPAVCVDGAAAAVCQATIVETPRPLDEARRREFFEQLAWFQWAPHEAEKCWRFILEHVG